MATEGAISKPLADVLRAGRADFNQRFKLAQQQHRVLTAEDWLGYLKSTLGPIVDRVAAQDAERVAAVVDVLYDQGLQLVAQRWLGAQARQPVLSALYRQLLMALAPALVNDPLRLSGSLLNALYQICQHDLRCARQWSDSLAAIAGTLSDVDTVLRLGTLLAWRAGMPVYRAAALQSAQALPPQLTQAALSLRSMPSNEMWEALKRAPALRPDEVSDAEAPVPQWLGWVGGFRGLGGPFAGRPLIGVAAGKLAASDGVDTWWLAADGYGVQSLRMGRLEDWPLQAPPALVRVANDGTVSARRHTQQFTELDSAAACVWHAGILAVTLRTSYQVALLRLPLP